MSKLRPRLLQIINEFVWDGEEPCYYDAKEAAAILDRVEDLLAEEGYVRLQTFPPGTTLRFHSGHTVEEVIAALAQADSPAQKARADSVTEKAQEPHLPKAGT